MRKAEIGPRRTSAVSTGTISAAVWRCRSRSASLERRPEEPEPDGRAPSFAPGAVEADFAAGAVAAALGAAGGGGGGGRLQAANP
ncbi:MAG: hypothetical protein ACKOUK_14715, partial [Verrucomicrobiota bacterium]